MFEYREDELLDKDINSDLDIIDLNDIDEDYFDEEFFNDEYKCWLFPKV